MNFFKLLTSKSIWIIIFLAAFLRLWNLSNIPPHLSPDEASLGYNAYSILKTGKDEYGKVFPIIFKSFGDYKPGLYVYLDVPFVATLGLNEFSTRLPSALAGVFSVLLIYLIVKHLFPSQKLLPEISALVASTNPWLIYFSRGAWESNVSLMFTLLGIYLFLKSIKNSKLIFFSVLSFAATLLTYQGAKLSTAFVVLILTTVYWKDIWSMNKKYLFGSTAIGLLISLPIILSLFNGQTNRLAVFSIFSYERPPESLNIFLSQAGEGKSDLIYYFFHTETVNFVRAISGRWFNGFSGNFLFFEGDTENPINTAPYQGVLLLSDLVFLLIGFFTIFKEKIDKEKMIFILWLILAPFSAAISRDTTNAVRSLNTAIPLIVVISFGLVAIIEFINKSKIQKILLIGLALFYLGGLTYFIDAYFVHVPAHNSNHWRYGYKEVVNTVSSIEPTYNNIVVEQSYNQPYIYFLYYQKYDPATYQKEAKLVESQFSGDVGFVEKLGKIEFKKIDWQFLKNREGYLVVSNPVSLPPDFSKDSNLIKEIKYLNRRDTAFYIVETK